MPLILVPTNFATIQLAIAAAAVGDTIRVEAAYATAESVNVTVNNLIFDGLTAQTGITLTLGPGIANLTMTGTTNFNAADNAVNNIITGNSGDNSITVSGGTDTVDGGAGTGDLLVISYGADTDSFSMNGAAQINDFVNTSISFSGIERFNATFGSGNDTIVLLGGNDTINGGAGDDSLNTAAGAAVVDGGAGGNDLWIADFSGDATVKNIDLNLAGIHAAGNGSTYVNIERMNITGGAGNDILTSRTSNANDGFADTLNGGLGNDTLTVGGGIDVVDGGVSGDDLLVIDYSTDTSNYSMNGPAQITDFIDTNVSFTNIERFNATFGSGNDTIILLGGNDTINGGGGDDSLDTAAGAAVVDGGVGGNDLWIADFSGDATAKNIDLNLAGIQIAGNGTTYVNVERMNISGGAGNDILTSRTGNPDDGFNDTLSGGAGDDTLTVGGGIDTVDGGAAGDDLLVINYAADIQSYLMNGTAQITDFSNTTVSFTNIERFNATFGSGNDIIVLGAGDDTLRGGAGLDTLNGGAGADALFGDAGNDIIVGGIGADTMSGGLGDDRLYVDNALDVVTEAAGAGTGSDSIFATVSYTIAANVERLYLQGAGNISGTGLDGQNDIIYGNAHNNILDGKTGGDNLNGGLGDDQYYVNTSTDVVNEAAGAGTGLDTIFAQTSYTMALNVEKLYLLDGGNYNANGRDGQNDFLAGNIGANILNGFSGDDVIRGGLGNDTLTGGLGLDIFQFLTAPHTVSNHDTITDFSVADDTIQMDNAIYTLLGANGVLAANLFKNLLTAQDADDRILYDQANGNLYYDSNGLAAGGVTLFADVTNGLALTAADFVVV
jgi:trimeric autotransporter adhesin